MGNATSILEQQIGSAGCSNTATENDDANALATLILDLVVVVAILWQLATLLPWDQCATCEDLPEEGRSRFILGGTFSLGMLFTGIGASLTIAACYPQQITTSAFTLALCYVISIEGLATCKNMFTILSNFPNAVALGFNSFVVWLAADSQSKVKNTGYWIAVNVWGPTGSPKIIILLCACCYVLSVIVATGLVIFATGSGVQDLAAFAKAKAKAAACRKGFYLIACALSFTLMGLEAANAHYIWPTFGPYLVKYPEADKAAPLIGLLSFLLNAVVCLVDFYRLSGLRDNQDRDHNGVQKAEVE